MHVFIHFVVDQNGFFFFDAPNDRRLELGENMPCRCVIKENRF